MNRWSVRAIALCVIFLVGCQRPGQNVYSYSEVGKASLVNFGTVVAVREVDVQGQNTGAGAAIGATGGAIAGYELGRGGGTAAATLGGAVIGGVIGALAEQAAANRKAIEYTVTLETGATMVIVQDHNEGEQPIKPGDRVMVQVTGGTQRVLPANSLPTEIKRPAGIKVTD
jgi:outer membrane lipoprotein SlyB